MISIKDALELIKGDSSYFHSLLTGKIMRILAEMLNYENNVEWELTGLLHDLDIDLIRDDMSKHGLVAADMLRGKIPQNCIHAIKSHDFRTGVEPTTLTDKALIFADAVSTVYEDTESLSNKARSKI